VLGRQELDGEMVDDREGALWTRALLDRQRAKTVPWLRRAQPATRAAQPSGDSPASLASSST
jgi:phage terminase large subunit-like protein